VRNQSKTRGKLRLREQNSIKNVGDFLQRVETLSESTRQKLWFRGHAKTDFRLLPTVGREQNYFGRRILLNRQQEAELLHRFRRRAYPIVNRQMTAGEALIVGRHHGLPTRLLDWTANALMALYFAAYEHLDRPGRVCALIRRDGIQEIDAFEFAKRLDEKEVLGYDLAAKRQSSSSAGVLSVKILHPFYNSQRLLAQDGIFTLHSDPWRSLEALVGETFQPKSMDIDHIVQWEIPAHQKLDIIRHLSRLGISHRTAFPDLDGIAKSLLETEVLWSPRAVQTLAGEPSASENP